MDLPYEILVYLFKYLPKSDRNVASETCRSWYEAANDKAFLSKKQAYFCKSLLEDDRTSPLNIFLNSPIIYPNYHFKEVELSNKTMHFWEQQGSNVLSFKLQSCDICEKVFIQILNLCPNLEILEVQSCRELFMSGRLLEGQTDGLAANSLDSLKVLSLAGNRYLSDALFNRFVATAPDLEELNLSSCAVSFHSGLVKKYYPISQDLTEMTPSESVLTFFYILHFITSKARFLKRLSFSDTLIDGAALKLLSEVEGLELQSLEVKSCDQLTNAGILALAAHQPSLTILDIGLCTRVTDQSLLHICNNLVNLKFLNIQRCRAVTDLGVQELHKLKKLTSLNISQCDLITFEGLKKGICYDVNNTLQQLNLNSLNLDEKSMVLISEKLPQLRSLDVSYCFNAVTDASIQVIFKNQIMLHTLRMSYCDKVSDAGLTGMGKCNDASDEPDAPIMATFSLPSACPKIHLGSRAEEDIVRDAQRKLDVMRMCENLTMDNYSGYSLARLKGLQELDMSGCNRITDVSLKYAFNFKELFTLNLSRCQQITHEGIEYLVRNCPSLEHLNLTDCFNLKDEAVSEVVKGLRRLKILELRGCNQVTDRSLEAIRSYCNKLKYLDVQGCRNISPELAISLSSIQTLNSVIVSKPGPYISEGTKTKSPAAPLLPALMRKLRLH